MPQADPVRLDRPAPPSRSAAQQSLASIAAAVKSWVSRFAADFDSVGTSKASLTLLLSLERDIACDDPGTGSLPFPGLTGGPSNDATQDALAAKEQPLVILGPGGDFRREIMAYRAQEMGAEPTDYRGTVCGQPTGTHIDTLA